MCSYRWILAAHFPHAIRRGAHSGTGEVWDLSARSPQRIITAVQASGPPHRVLPDG